MHSCKTFGKFTVLALGIYSIEDGFDWWTNGRWPGIICIMSYIQSGFIGHGHGLDLDLLLAPGQRAELRVNTRSIKVWVWIGGKLLFEMRPEILARPSMNCLISCILDPHSNILRITERSIRFPYCENGWHSNKASQVRYPISKELDPYFEPIIRECSRFLTCHGFSTVYNELHQALHIHDVSPIDIQAYEENENETTHVRHIDPLDNKVPCRSLKYDS